MEISLPHQASTRQRSKVTTMPSVCRALLRGVCSPCILLFAVCALVLPNPVFATIVTVNWSASVTPNLPGSPSPGPGFLSGSLGTFDVTAVGDTFTIPPDSSISIDASGFVGGFPNDTYLLDRGTANPFQLEFLGIGPTAADFSVNIVDTNAGLLSAFPNPCVVDGVAGQCFVGLVDTAGTGVDIALAALGLDGTINDESHGLIEYSFIVDSADVPEPVTLALLATGLLALRYRRRHSLKSRF